MNEEFLLKFNKAMSLEMQYHTGPKDKPNMTKEKFLVVIRNLKNDNMTVKFNDRTSTVGPNSKTGENETFHINFDFYVLFKRRNERYYCHGYFYDIGNLRGVYIHAAREE
jgi:hypothetical protein